MKIPNGAFIPLYLVSFVVLSFEYFRTSPERRVMNLHFGLMAGAVVLIFTAIFVQVWFVSLVLFVLALFWLGLSLYLLRRLPPPRI